MKATITVGALARQAGVQIDTIRYYERRKLLPKPPRNPAGYRTFTEADVERVRFIRQAQALGFSLTEIEGLIALRAGKGEKCSAVRAKAQAKAEDIDKKIEALRSIKHALGKLIAACPDNAAIGECSFLDNLATTK